MDLTLVGRDAVVDDLTAAARAAREGRGSVVLLTGEAGIGKTTVARHIASAVDHGLEVSWGRCSADGGAPPFWPWRDLVGVGTPDAPGTNAPASESGFRYDLLNGLRDAIVARSARGPVLHVIEDLQWADVASVLLLAHVAVTVDVAPVLLLATVRTGEALGAPLHDAIEEVRRSARTCELAPLERDDIEVLVRSIGMPSEPGLTALIQARTGGNPLFVTELLRAASADRRAATTTDAVAARVPDRVSDLIVNRQARLPPAVADLLATAAVFGRDGDTRVLADAHRLTVATTLDLLEQGRAARFIDAVDAGRWQFRHDIVRDAVYQRLSSTDRAERHARALDALAKDTSTPPAVLAAHAVAALPLLDADRAVALAARAGQVALTQLAYEEAIAWFDKALQATPPNSAPRWRAELMLLSADAHRHIGAIDDARAAFRAAADQTDEADLVARAALGYADPGADLGIAYRSADPVTAPLLERAIALQPDGDSRTTVCLEARLAAELYFSDEPARSRQLTTRALERARRLGDPLAMCAAMAVHHDAFVVGQADLAEQLRESDELLEWARAAGTEPARLTAHRARVFDLLAAGDLVGMDTAIVSFRRIADPLRVPAYDWWPALWSAMRALLEGRHDEAEALAVQAYTVGERPFALLAMMNLSFLLFFLRREQGRLDELEAATRDFAATAADIPALRVALIFLLCELRRLDEAAELLTAIDDHELERLHDRNWPPAWFQLTRVAFLTRDAHLAGRLLERRPNQRCVMVSLASVCLGAVDLGMAWAHHARGDLDAAEPHYRCAEDVNARIGARSWLAQSRIDHARLLLDRDAAGDRAAARDLVDQAARAAERLSLMPVLAELDDLRARLDNRPAADAAPGTAAVFRREGQVWNLEYARRTVRLPDTRGLADIAYLLARPDQSISVTELTAGGGPGDGAPQARGALALDDRARRQIRDRLHELDAQIDEAEADNDGERAAMAREARQRLAESVARDLGLGGRSRRVDDPIERARKTVSTRIRRAVHQIERVHPELGRHLARSIDTGTWCAYRPADSVVWRT